MDLLARAARQIDGGVRHGRTCRPARSGWRRRLPGAVPRRTGVALWGGPGAPSPSWASARDGPAGPGVEGGGARPTPSTQDRRLQAWGETPPRAVAPRRRAMRASLLVGRARISSVAREGADNSDRRSHGPTVPRSREAPLTSVGAEGREVSRKSLKPRRTNETGLVGNR